MAKVIYVDGENDAVESLPCKLLVLSLSPPNKEEIDDIKLNQVCFI